MKLIRNWALKKINITIKKTYKEKQNKYPTYWVINLQGGTLRIYTAKFDKLGKKYYDERYAVFKLWDF